RSQLDSKTTAGPTYGHSPSISTVLPCGRTGKWFWTAASTRCSSSYASTQNEATVALTTRPPPARNATMAQKTHRRIGVERESDAVPVPGRVEGRVEFGKKAAEPANKGAGPGGPEATPPATARRAGGLASLLKFKNPGAAERPPHYERRPVEVRPRDLVEAE